MRFAFIVHVGAIFLNLIAISFAQQSASLSSFAIAVIGFVMLLSFVALFRYKSNAGAQYAAASLQFGSALYVAGAAPELIAAVVFLAMLPAIVVSR